MPITPGLAAFALYTGLLTFVLIWLGFVIGKMRGELKISIGDGGNPVLLRAMRGQANFIENVPMALLLLLGMALFGAPAWLIHGLGIILVAARVLHGLHFTKADAPRWQRAAGAGLTVLVLVVGALGLIGHALVNL
jgi:uncharacterized membrane protein YecN with MAPEG domain